MENETKKQHMQWNNNQHSITYAEWVQKLGISWILYTKLQNKIQCMASLHKHTKPNTIQTSRSFCEITEKSA